MRTIGQKWSFAVTFQHDNWSAITVQSSKSGGGTQLTPLAAGYKITGGGFLARQARTRALSCGIEKGLAT